MQSTHTGVFCQGAQKNVHCPWAAVCHTAHSPCFFFRFEIGLARTVAASATADNLKTFKPLGLPSISGVLCRTSCTSMPTSRAPCHCLLNMCNSDSAEPSAKTSFSEQIACWCSQVAIAPLMIISDSSHFSCANVTA